MVSYEPESLPLAKPYGSVIVATNVFIAKGKHSVSKKST